MQDQIIIENIEKQHPKSEGSKLHGISTDNEGSLCISSMQG